MWKRFVTGCLCFTFVAAYGTELVSDEPVPTSALEQEEYSDLLELFVETFNDIDRNYVDLISRRELMEAAIDGMLSKLDQHSAYITPAKLERYRRNVDNEFGGIGVQVMMNDGQLTIVSPIFESPAYRAKLTAGDVILQVDGNSTAGLTLAEAVALMKGKLGTTVELTIRHPDHDRRRRCNLLARTFELERFVATAVTPTIVGLYVRRRTRDRLHTNYFVLAVHGQRVA